MMVTRLAFAEVRMQSRRASTTAVALTLYCSLWGFACTAPVQPQEQRDSSIALPDGGDESPLAAREPIIVADFSKWTDQKDPCGGWGLNGSEWRIWARCRGAVGRTVMEPSLADFEARVRARQMAGGDGGWDGLVAGLSGGP